MSQTPDSYKWIEWNGGDNPCPPGAVVEWKTRAMPASLGFFGPAQADLLDWRHRDYGDDIVWFMIVGDMVMRGPAEPQYPVQPAGVDATLAERGNRYGSFTTHAKITQEIKAAMAKSPNWNTLACDQREALEMVAHKVGRILNGDPDYLDSWHDIIGYVRLVERRLRGEV